MSTAQHAGARVPIAVLLGGPSAEHDVSIVSGNAVADALESNGHPVRRILIDLGGAWWWLPAGHRRDDRPTAAYHEPAALDADGPFSAGTAVDRLAGGSSPTTDRDALVVFIALHGPFGEDGTVQAMLESAGLAYTGSGVTASAIGMDKAIFKRLVRGLGLPVVDWREIHAGRWAREPDAVLGELEAFAAATGEQRLMVKPARLGSSVGMTLAHGPDDRAAALDMAFRYDTLALAERYLQGARDLEVSVIGNDRLEQYGPGEIVSGHEFYDYAAKYTPGLSESSLRAEVPAALRATILKYARDAYRAIGAEGFARVDFLLAGSTLVVSEINTIPGFTPISLFPALPAEGGLDFAAVCERVVDLARERHAARARAALTAADLPR
ncbi:MAG TPA: D-alanine--D-alanine ligase family protein [Candidatus Acidoferrum sp.]|nr:D-alanine--D-alanine ligase family protein [Candidatus Acidoferrum sp.]